MFWHKDIGTKAAHKMLLKLTVENFSPLYECLLPNQSLYIDPGFYFGELHKTILSGRLPVEDNVAFVPNPVDTTTVSFPCHFFQFLMRIYTSGFRMCFSHSISIFYYLP